VLADQPQKRIVDPDSVRHLLCSRPPREALRAELAALLEDGARLGSCRLKRSKFSSGSIEASYDVMIQGGNGGPSTVRALQVTWELVEGAGRTSPVVRPVAGGVPPEVRWPFRILEADVPPRAMRIQISPFDAKYSRLWRLFEPGYLDDALGASPGPDRPAAGRHRLTVLRYSPGRRHLIRFDPTVAHDGKGVIFAKVRKGKHEVQSLRFAQELAALAREAGLRLQVVQRLVRLPEDAVDLYPKAEGEPFDHLLRRRDPATFELLHQLGSQMRRLHGAARGSASGLLPQGFEDEWWATAVENERLRPLIPAAARRVDGLLSMARDLDARLVPEPPTMCHGDFKTEHVWVGSEGGFRLIDCDSAALGEPAKDLGKFLADLQWWHAECGLPGLPEAQGAFLDGYGLGGQPWAALRVRLYEAVVLLRVTLRRVRLVDEDWVSGLEPMIDRAQAMIDRLRGLSGFGGPSAV